MSDLEVKGKLYLLFIQIKLNRNSNYLTGPEMLGMVEDIHAMREFDEFMRYLCREADFDFYLYLNTLADLLSHPRFPQ